MKIIELQAENVKRLKAVDITPDGTLQIIGGRNAQGKSAVLDSIWLELSGVGVFMLAVLWQLENGEWGGVSDGDDA